MKKHQARREEKGAFTEKEIACANHAHDLEHQLPSYLSPAAPASLGAGMSDDDRRMAILSWNAYLSNPLKEQRPE